jgi:DNA polymerase elongation subunit (family B)
MQVYDIKAFDSDSKLMLLVNSGNGMKMTSPDMDFFMEAPIINFLDLSDVARVIDRGWTDVDNESMISIKYQNLATKEKIKAMYETSTSEYLRNADIPEELQWILYHKHTIANFLEKPLLFDMEVDPTDFAFWDEENTVGKFNNRIYSIASMDLDGNPKFFLEEDEETLIRKFYSYAIRYTAMSGWNSSNFDYPYLVGRTKFLRINNINWESIPQIDMMVAFEDYREKTKEFGDVVYKGLDYVANEYLDSG